MKRIPKSFQMGSHTFTVRMVDEDEMDRLVKPHSAYAVFFPDELAIYVRKPARKLKASVVKQSFWHEVGHALLWVQNHKDWTNEKVVDALGHHLKQIHDTAKF